MKPDAHWKLGDDEEAEIVVTATGVCWIDGELDTSFDTPEELRAYAERMNRVLAAALEAYEDVHAAKQVAEDLTQLQ